MRYDIGDKVLIKNIDWYDANKDHLGEVWFHNCVFLKDMAKYCGKVYRIKHVTKYGYRLEGIPYHWNDNMIEGLVEMKNVNNPDDKIIQSWLDLLQPQWKDIKVELDKKRKKENKYLDKEKRVLFKEVNWWPDCKISESYLTKEDKIKDMGEVSDGYHTFNELYEYRKLYNAALFNEWANIPGNPYNIHKSKLHSDGKIPFGDPNWFIVMAELPTGQISNHYEMKDWNLFQIPIKEKANVWDGHTPKDVAERIRKFLSPKPKYPLSYEECCKVLFPNSIELGKVLTSGYNCELLKKIGELLICRDAYWKIAGEEMRLGKSWEPQDTNTFGIFYDRLTDEIEQQNGYNGANSTLEFPTEEMRDAFYENFKDLIEECKELL